MLPQNYEYKNIKALKQQNGRMIIKPAQIRIFTVGLTWGYFNGCSVESEENKRTTNNKQYRVFDMKNNKIKLF